jgi:imidazolonepropionase-like amidohydrolase
LADSAAGVRFFRVQQALTRTLAREGVGLLAGTDVGPYAPTIPGFSLHDELAQLVAAGLTPLAALQAATIGPARFLGRAGSLGEVAVGHRADLVVLDANPLTDIRNVARIHAVVVGGAVLTSGARAQLLERLRAAGL